MRLAYTVLFCALAACATGEQSIDMTPSAEVTETTDGGLYDITWAIAPSPHQAGVECGLIFDLAADGDFITPTSVGVTPWMVSMNHGIAGDPHVQDLEEGRFDARWTYSMSGEWLVTIDVDARLGADFLELAFDVL